MPRRARTASRGAVQATDTQRTERSPGPTGQFFLHQLSDHGHECRMSASGPRACEGNAQLSRGLASLGVDPMVMSPAEFEAHVQREIALNANLVKAVGIKPE